MNTQNTSLKTNMTTFQNQISSLKQNRFAYLTPLLGMLLIFFIPIYTTVTQIIMAVIVVNWAITVPWHEKSKTLFSHPITLWILVLFLIFTVGILYAHVPIADSGKMLFKMSKFLYIPILLPIFKDEKWRKRGVEVFILSMGVTLLLGYLKVYTSLPISSRFTQACIFKNHIDTSLLMSMACFFLGQHLFQSKKPFQKVIVLGIMALMTFHILYLCEGRSGQILFFALGLLLCLQRLSFTQSFLGIGALALIFLAISFTPSRFNQRMHHLSQDLQQYHQLGETSTSGGQRAEYFLNSLNIAKEHPWIGAGTGTFKQSYEQYAQPRNLRLTTNPHNEYLNILVQWGLVGLIAFLGFCISILKTSFSLPSSFERYSLQGVFLTMIIGCFGNSWFMDFTSGYFLVTFIALFIAGSIFESKPNLKSYSNFPFLKPVSNTSTTTTAPPKISVIITSYNWPSALNLVMEALRKQTVLPYEILIADDGSTDETKQLIDHLKTSFPVPIHHIWQPDEGFRASAIRNKALAQASGDYIIFMDGDCLPRSTFIERHGKLAEPGFFVAGNRVLLSQNYTHFLLSPTSQTSTHKPFYEKSLIACFLMRLQGHCNRFIPFLSFPLGAWRKRNPTDWKGAKGCNLGIWKMDLLRINGWEERFSGWGFEDSDLVIRLIRIGIRRKDGRYAVPVIHLWHKENDRSRQTENWNLLLTTQQAHHWVAEQGLEKEKNYYGT